MEGKLILLLISTSEVASLLLNMEEIMHLLVIVMLDCNGFFIYLMFITKSYSFLFSCGGELYSSFAV